MRDGGTCPLGNGEMILGDVDEEEFRNALATLPGRSFAVEAIKLSTYVAGALGLRPSAS